MNSVPHPIPYQGSKRKLAPAILSYFPRSVDVLLEPFAGSAAVTIAAAVHGKARRFHINDCLEPLVGIWRLILAEPQNISDRYRLIWEAQLDDPRSYYDRIRDEFNTDADPVKLLYLLARCVKNAVRFNSDGLFNQSPDNRRLGMRPKKMTRSIWGANEVLKERTETSSEDFATMVESATTSDLIYMDPPYQGTSTGKDHRYFQSLSPERFAAELGKLVGRDIRFIISYDGRCGNREYGSALPEHLRLTRIEVNAGRSSQATLNGRDDLTYESLYLSPALTDDLISEGKLAR